MNSQPNKPLRTHRWFAQRPRTSSRKWSPISVVALPALLLLALDPSAASAGAPKSKKSRSSKATPKLEVHKAVNQIDGLTVEELTDGTTILRLLGHVEPTFNVYRLSDPERLVVDISKSERGEAVPHVPVDSWAVGRVSISSVEEHDSKIARVVVNLKRESSYIVVPKGRDLAITITPKEVAPEAYFARKSAGQRQAEIESMKAEAREQASELQASARKQVSELEASARKQVSELEASARKQALVVEASARQQALVVEAKARKRASKLESDAKVRAKSAEAKAKGAEAKAKGAEAKAVSAETRASSAETRASSAETRARDAERRAEDAAAKAREAERQAAKIRGEAAKFQARAEAAAAKRERDAMVRAKELEARAADKLSEARRLAEARKSTLADAEQAAAYTRSKALEVAAATEGKAKQAERAARQAAAEAERRASEAEGKVKQAQREARLAAAEAERRASEAEGKVKQAESKAKQLAAVAQDKAKQVTAAAQSKAEKVTAAARRKAERAEQLAAAALSEAEQAAAAAARKVEEAERKAKQLAAVAQTKAKQVRAAAHSEAERLAAVAQSKAKQVEAAAYSEAEQLAAVAQSKAKQVRAAAQSQAEQVTAAARTKAERTEQVAAAAMSDAELAAAAAARKVRHADQRAAEAAAEAVAAEVYATRVRKSADAKAKQAEQLLAQAESAMGLALEESEQAEQAHGDAKQALTDARKAARKLGKRDDDERQQLQRAVKQAEDASAAAKKRERSASVRLAQLQRDHEALSLALETKNIEAAQLRGELEAKQTELAGAHDTVRKARAQYESVGGDRGPSEGEKRSHRKAKSQLAKAESLLVKVRKQTETEQRELEALQQQVAVAGEQLGETLAATQKRRSLTQQWEEERAAAGQATVRDVRFEDGPDGARVIVELDGPVIYNASSLTPNMTMLELRDARIPSGLERSLDTTSFNGPIDRITSFREGDDVKIVVASSAGNPAGIELDRNANRLIWKFPKLARDESRPGLPQIASDTSQTPPERTEVVSLGGNKVSGFSTPPVMAARPGTKIGSRSRWRGERIDIELQDAPIKDVLLLFSDIGRVNIIAGPEVQGTITMKLSAVPWDQALDIILRSLALGMVQEGNVIRVSTQSNLEDERRKAIEEANAAVQLKPLNTRLLRLSYATVGEMLPKVQSVLSSRGTVTPDSRTNTLIVMDVAENIALAESLVGQLDSQTPQVLIEARIVEARTNWLRQLGIQWGFDFIASPGTGNPTGLLFPNSVGIGGGSGGNQSPVNGLILPGAAANPNYAVDLPAPVSTGTGGALGFSFGSLSGNLNTNLRLSAAEDEGEVRIISAPKIVTLDNTQAQIEQGVQIPISQVSAQGVNTRYVNATLGLQVTPHVTNEGAVMLEVQVQKNEADFVNTGARGDPTILTKSAESQLLIVDGDTAVIGGIYTRSQGVNHSKVPWFADIPIIGWFFKNKTERDDRSEMLIFLTPRIVNRSTSIGG